MHLLFSRIEKDSWNDMILLSFKIIYLIIWWCNVSLILKTCPMKLIRNKALSYYAGFGGGFALVILF